VTWQPQLKRKVLYKLRHYSCLCYKCLFTSKYYLEAKDFDGGSLLCGSDGSVFIPIKILFKITLVGFLPMFYGFNTCNLDNQAKELGEDLNKLPKIYNWATLLLN